MKCRSCSNEGLVSVLDLGRTPLAGAILETEDLAAGEPRYPLELAFCPSCGLVQILETVDPEVLFRRRYPYFSSFSDELLRHSRENALELMRSRGLGPESLVVEVASNDGYMLRNFVAHGIPCLGIDPAEGPAAAARAAGVPTLNEFFGRDLAGRLKRETGGADVVIANNVLAHATGLNDFLDGVRELLKDGGVAVFEVPYLRDLVEKCEFDTIYHEHLCYFSAVSLDSLFRRHSLHINDIRRLPIHGGSLRVYAGHGNAPSARVEALLEEERAMGLDRARYYDEFKDRVVRIKDGLNRMLFALKDGGSRIAAYGAAAKGSTLLNYCGIGRDVLDFVVDRNTHKIGRFMPGSRIPIYSTGRLIEEMPDYALILAWNFAQEIMRQQEAYTRAGGRFILPIPEFRIA